MKAANRFLQVLAVLGAVASGVFYFLSLSDQSTTTADSQSLSEQLRKSKGNTARLQEQLETQQNLVASQKADVDKLTEDALLANNQLLQIQRENKRLVDERDAQELAERRLQKENSRLTQELNSLKATSVPQDEIARYELQIANLERQILEMKETTSSDFASGSLPPAIAANAKLKGNVLTVGKGASFVVLDIGYNDGVRLQNELYVQHADTPIAKIQVTEVKENLSIARVLPESLVKTPQTGDSVSSLN